MRALYVPTVGAQPELGELPTPTATDGTVLIRVKAAGLNPVDNAIAAGMMAGMMPHEYPLVLGRDAAGVVEAVGPGVEGITVGDEVVGHMLLAPPVQAGTLAEYAVLPAATVVAKPANLDFVTAAAIPLAGAAASQAVEAIDPHPGQTVLINGAGGGVGSYAVQLLAAQGVTVIATASPDSADRLRKLGATSIVDHTAGPVAEQVRAAYPDGVDALINLVGYTPDAVPAKAVRNGGKVSTLTAEPDEQLVADANLTSTMIMARATSDVVGPLLEQAAAGTLEVSIAEVLPFEQAAAGLATIAAGKAGGKLVVDIEA
ncbi:MAG TPA: NADP-dependent oxidoreductase [Acidimicrobiales bacterium]|nr:NADP-dependent oxidoreductase [Acidimicrobiales bacterium]